MKDQENKKNNKFINTILFLIIIFILLCLYARIIEPKLLIIKEYKVESETLPSNFDGIKIVHFSDLYYYSTTSEEDLKKLVDKINLVKPDIVVFTGNIVSPSSSLKEEDKDIIIELFKEIDATLGKYIVKGNSDYKLKDYEEIVNKSEFILLDNSYDLIYNNGYTPIFIAGLSSSTKSVVDFPKAFSYYSVNEEKINGAEYKILLFSESDLADDALSYDPSVNLMLSGNSLNGYINLFNINQYLTPEGSKKYYKNEYMLGSSYLFVSSGIGTNTLKYRFNNMPSFNIYRLKTI